MHEFYLQGSISTLEYCYCYLGRSTLSTLQMDWLQCVRLPVHSWVNVNISNRMMKNDNGWHLY